MLEIFRNCYPQGSLVSELIDIDRGLYIVKVSVQVEGIILATGLAAADKIEAAEDRARERAISTLTLENHLNVRSQAKSVPTPNQTAAKNDSETKSYSNVVNLSVPQASTPLSTPRALESPESPVVEPKPAPEPPPLSHPRENQTVIDTAADNSGSLFDGTFDSQAAETTTVPIESEEISAMPPVDSTVANPTVEIDQRSEQEPPEFTSTNYSDFNAIKHETDIELKRLGWTRDDGRSFLQRKYGKRSRLSLTDEQLLEFLQHLKSLPTPE